MYSPLLSYSLHGLPPNFYYYWGNGSFDWPITQKKKKKKEKNLKLWRLTNIAISIYEERMPSLWFIYIGEKGKTWGETLGKGYGTK
jgi:hypothetical protein